MTPKRIPKTTSKKVPPTPIVKIHTLRSSIAYLTVIGWFIAYFICEKNENDYEMFHIRQSFGLHMTMFVCEILGSFSMIPYPLVQILWLVYIITFLVFFIQSLRSKKAKIAILGDKFQDWFPFL